MMKIKEIIRKIIGVLIIVLFLGITINMSINESTASSIKSENNYSVFGTVYEYPTGHTAQGIEVLYYDGYGQSFRDITDSNGRYLIEFNRDPGYNNFDYVVAAKNVNYECVLLFVENLTISYNLWIAAPSSGKIYGRTIYFDNAPVGNVEVKLNYCIQPSVYRNMTTTSSSNGYYEFTNLYIDYCNVAPMYSYELSYKYNNDNTSIPRYIRIGEYGNFTERYDILSKTINKHLFLFPFFEKILNQLLSLKNQYSNSFFNRLLKN
ncbi:MAG: hypothetical protein MUO82_08870 [Candidatus Thermoplasmatota archaeon]|nr:hypothetical protein [Candidatus Thermoplasmatota archaeon]